MAVINTKENYYSKLVVARFSPKNKCHVADGETLCVKPRMQVPFAESVTHHFVSAKDGITTSQFGWVKDADHEFTVDEFIEENIGEADPSQRAHIETMLNSIANLPADTPIAASYVRRGIEQRRMEFEVHRVFFHK